MKKDSNKINKYKVVKPAPVVKPNKVVKSNTLTDTTK